MEIRKFKNWEQVYDVISHGALFYYGSIYAGNEFNLYHTSKNPALYYNGNVIARSLKDINREMNFYNLIFVLD